MPKLNEQGGGSIDCRPRYLKAGSRAAQQRNLFEPPPRGKLEPAYNAAYEGYGYPAAGYGQTRRQVVPLAHPKVMTKDGPALIGTRITTMGTLNPKSHANTKAEVAALMGLGCACSPIDHAMARKVGLAGLGQNLSVVQQFADAITQNAVPNSLLNRIAAKIISDERANVQAYKNIAALRAIDPKNIELPTLQRAQENAWGETNTAKFYALLVPEMQSRLVGKVTPPDYKYIKSGNTGSFTKVANFIREKVVGDAARNLIAQKYMTDSSLGGLGFVQFVIGGAVAVLIAGALIAYIESKNSDAAQINSRAAIVATCASGKLSKSACAAALNANPDTDWGSIAMYGAIGVGGLVALQVISSIRSAFPGR